MTPEQQAAFIMAQAACAMAEIAGMTAENQYRMANGEHPLYGEDAFSAVPLKYGVDHNAVIGFFRG